MSKDKDSIEIKWSAVDSADYEASLAALQTYEHLPKIKATIRLKGRISPEGVKRILQVAMDHDAAISVNLKGEWDAGDSKQIRLFPADYATPTVADIEGWLNG